MECRDTLLAILASPADYLGEMLAEMVWECSKQYYDDGKPADEHHSWRPPFMSYSVKYDGGENSWKWEWCRDGYYDEGAARCDSLEHGKQLCRADFLGRMKAAFRTSPAVTEGK